MNEPSTAGKVLAVLTVLEGDKHPAKLLAFGPPDEEADTTGYAEQLARRLKRGGGKEIMARFHSWAERSPSLPIKDIHPSWILESIHDESPRVIGLICRYLPGSHVRYLLENMPVALKDRLPALSESFAIPEALVGQVHDLFERRFFSLERPGPEETFSVRHVPWMNSRDIMLLVHELGYEEIRQAFANVVGKALQVFLTRFPIHEANEVRLRMARGRPVIAAERKHAQEHLVRIDLNVERAIDLPFEIGMSVIAQAVDPEQADWIEAVILRLNQRDGYRLKRYARDACQSHSDERLKRRQAGLLTQISVLAEQGKITRYWREDGDEDITAGS